jgi:prefoldin subunit 5
MALAEHIAAMETRYNEAIEVLSNEVATLRDLLTKQNQVLGNVLQQVMGSGSTVREV